MVQQDVRFYCNLPGSSLTSCTFPEGAQTCRCLNSSCSIFVNVFLVPAYLRLIISQTGDASFLWNPYPYRAKAIRTCGRWILPPGQEMLISSILDMPALDDTYMISVCRDEIVEVLKPHLGWSLHVRRSDGRKGGEFFTVTSLAVHLLSPP